MLSGSRCDGRAAFLSCTSSEKKRIRDEARAYTRGKTTDCLTVSPSVSPATPSRTDGRRERERERRTWRSIAAGEPRDRMTDNSVRSIVHLVMDLFSTILYSRHSPPHPYPPRHRSAHSGHATYTLYAFSITIYDPNLYSFIAIVGRR